MQAATLREDCRPEIVSFSEASEEGFSEPPNPDRKGEGSPDRGMSHQTNSVSRRGRGRGMYGHLDTEPGAERNAGSASNAAGDGCGRAPSDEAGFQPYWGKPAVRHDKRGWGKRGQDLMAICHNARKGRNTGSHWSKPVAPPLYSTHNIKLTNERLKESIRPVNEFHKRRAQETAQVNDLKCRALVTGFGQVPAGQSLPGAFGSVLSANNQR